MSSCCVEFLSKLIVEVQHRQASVIACIVLAGTSERLADLRVLERSRYRCCGTEWFFGIILVKILHSVEGGDVEQGCSNLETNLPCLRDCSLSLTCVYILHALIIHIHYLLDILLPYYYMLGDYLLTLVLTKRAKAAPQFLSRGILRR